MATGRWYKCGACGHRDPKWPSMYVALRKLVTGELPECPRCRAVMQLHLNYPFALGAGAADAIAVDGFLPDPCPTWQDQGRDVTFYPFLVIVEQANSGRAIWL